MAIPWDRPLWRRVFKAVQRILAATVFLVAHAAFHFTVKRVFAGELQDLPKLGKFLDVIGLIAFLAITTALLWEAVRIFLPLPVGITLEGEEGMAPPPTEAK